MTQFYIRPFAFVDFFEQEWPVWKFHALNTAQNTILEKLEGEEAGYAYAGNQSKIPILWDADDYKFLSQFPPSLWSRALQWRYNEGLLEASKLRDADPDHSLEAVPETRDVLVFRNKDGKRFEFYDVWTGLRSLLKRLETPIKYHTGHNPPGAEGDTPGIRDIDPWDDDAASPKHRSRYIHGLMDYDVTNPVEVTDEYIDSIPDDEINIDPETPPDKRAEAIAIAREAMKRSRHHTFAGMSVLKPVVVSRLINTWIRAQGLGLLGATPEKHKDPHTGEELPVEYGTPHDVNPYWDNSVGEEVEPDERTAGGKLIKKGKRKIPLRIPIVKRRLNMKVFNAEGEEVPQEEGPVAMPVLNPGRLLPRVVNLSPAQRQQFALRRGFNAEEACPGSAGKSWEQIEADCTAARRAGSPQDAYNLLMNFDILTPEQIDHLIKNQRELIHLVHAKFGTNTCPQCKGAGKIGPEQVCPHCFGTGKDPWSQPKGHYIVGWTPNKAKREIVPSDMTPEQLAKAVQKYFNELYFEANKSIDYFIKWAKGGGDREQKLPDAVLEMLRNVQPSLANVCAALLGLNLNHPNMGIRDPAVGLTNVPISKKDKVYILEKADEPKIIDALMKKDLPKEHQTRAGAGAGVAVTKLDFNTAQKIAKYLIAHANPEGNWPEKLESLPIDWIMKALTRRKIAKAYKLEDLSKPSPDDEDADAEEGAAEEAEDERDEGGLTAEERSRNRMNYAFNFARDLSQAAFGAVGSRRFREKHGVSTVSTTSGKSDDEGDLEDVIAGGEEGPGTATSDGGSGAVTGADYEAKLGRWFTRRVQLDPEREPSYDDKGHLVYPVSRIIWNVTKIGHEIDKFFRTKRNIIQAALGSSFAAIVDQAQERMKAEVAAMNELMGQAAQELYAQNKNISQDELDQRSREIAASRLPDYLKERHPNLYGDMAEDEMAQLIARHGGGQNTVPPELQEEMDEYMEDFLKELMGGVEAKMPRYNPDTEDFIFSPKEWTLADFKKDDAFGVVQFLRLTWTEAGVKKWAVPLFMAIQKHHGSPVSEDDAVHKVLEAGVIPIQADAEDIAAAKQPAAPTPSKTDTVPLTPAPTTAAPAPAPAAAATDINAMLADLPQHYETLRARKQELAANKPAFMAALTKLRQQILQKRQAKQPIDPEELNAVVSLGALAGSL
jgi:hypothetical protein